MRSWPYLCLALVALSACASTPKVDYYTLAMEPSGRVGTDHNLVVESMRTTEALSRSQIMIQTSATEIEYYATAHWAGSIGELVEQKLTIEFGQAREGRRTLTLSGTVLACEQVDVAGGAEARMRMRVVIRDPGEKAYKDPVRDSIYAATRPASAATPGAVVQALSKCAEDIAVAIAEDLSALS
jgi:uncharacterized lipoprotein YmbA